MHEDDLITSWLYNLVFSDKKKSNSQNVAHVGFEFLQLVRILTPNKSLT